MKHRKSWRIRAVTVLLGATLIVIGGVGLLWQFRPELITQHGYRFAADYIDDAPLWEYWNFALAAGAIVLLIMSLLWLFSRIPSRPSRTLMLERTHESGKLSANRQAIATASKSQFTQIEGVQSVKTSFGSHNDYEVLSITLKAHPNVSLTQVHQAAEANRQALKSVLAQSSANQRIFISSLQPTRRDNIA